MRQVVAKPLLSYFVVPRNFKKKWRGFPKLFQQSPRLNPVSLMTCLGIFLVVAGAYSTLCLAAGLSLFLIMVGLYFHTHASAHNLHVERKSMQKQCMEMQKVQVQLVIINSSMGRSACFQVIDRIKASEKDHVQFEFPHGLPAKTKVVHSYTRVADGGSGIKKLGPVRIQVFDFLGLFHFEVIEDNVEVLQVLPKIEKLPDLELRGAEFSDRYGSHELEKSGLSVKFRGIREYARGDSLKHVAWRISAKNNELMVKEFDRMVNSNVYVALNDHESLHMGRKSHSTWECGRDVSLSIVSQQLEQGNSVHFLTNQWALDLNRTTGSFELLAHKLIQQTPDPKSSLETETAEKSTLRLLRQLRYVEPGSCVFLVTVFSDFMEDPLQETLGTLLQESVQVFVVFVDLQSFIDQFSASIDFTKAVFFPPMAHFHRALHRLQILGVEIIVLQSGHSIQESFLHLSLGGRSA